MISAGVNLRNVREKLGLTLHDVEAASERLAKRHKNGKYLIPTSRLSEFENKGTIPSIHRLYSLAIIYRSEFRELPSWNRVDLNQATSDIDACALPHPLSPVPPKVFRFPKEAEVIGQVIGVAMRLGRL